MVKGRNIKAKSLTAKSKAKKRARRPKIKRVKARRPARKKVTPLTKAPTATLEKIGKVTHYFPKVKAAAVLVLKDSIKLGDEIYIKGHTTDFKEKITSMELDHVPIKEGKKGQEIGLLVKSRVRIGDSVYKL